MRVLVLGAGAREHALCRALARDPAVTALACAPGNGGTPNAAETLPVSPTDPAVSLTDPAAVVALARSWSASLVVVGPEAPLVAGVADALGTAGIAVFGPSAAAARIESSKSFAKSVMAAAGVPTARSLLCESTAQVAAAIDAFGPPYVVKDDGLAAGKGVLVTGDRAAALAHAVGRGRVLVEEHLAGPEVSLFAVTDGVTVLPLLPAQDFKRVGDDDTGPNTGGMGAYAPLPWAPAGLVEEVTASVLRPTVEAMAARGTPFAGLLYAGLVLTSAGVKVIEFNARFGDPETQVVLALLDTPLAGLLAAAAAGRLADHPPLAWRSGAAVTVVVTAAGYPGVPRTGDPVSWSPVEGVDVLHAGTRGDGDRLVSSGGRVLSVTAVAGDLGAARRAAYDGVASVRLAGGHWRSDIALAAVEGEVSVPVR